MRHARLLACSFVLAVATTACSLGQTARMGTGIVSHTVCTALFVSEVDGDRAYQDGLRPLPPIGALDWAIRYEVDRRERKVTARVLGGYEESATYQEGGACQSHPGGPPIAHATRPDASGDAIVTADGALGAAVAAAFTPSEHTKAVVVVHHGRIVAERYAPGYGVTTPVPGYSDTKSVMNALIGILAHRGQLRREEPAPIAEWAGDGRKAITIEALLRMRSGLAWDESLTGGADDAARMWFLEHDMASLPIGRPLADTPGSRWQYNSGNSLVLARIVRDAVGGTQDAVLRFADDELFAPLAMRHVALELDSVGTPNGGSGMLASPRDWARFGWLYLSDGAVGGRRILPAGWADWSASPASDAWVGYGAAFWTNRGDSRGATRRREWGMPAGSFFASGVFGQVVVVDPADDLVIARFGWSHGDFGGLDAIAHHVGAVVAAVRAKSDARGPWLIPP